MTRKGISQGLMVLAFAMLTACGGGGGDDPNGGLVQGGGSADTGSGANNDAGGGSTTQIPTGQLPLDPAPSGSGTYTCRDVKLGAVIVDTVYVPAGASCALEGTRLIGTAEVDRGAFLEAVAVDINGNVKGQGAGHVSVTGRSIVGGSIQLEQGQSATVRGVTVIGNIQLTDNRGALVVEQNLVEGNIQIRQNRGGVTVNANRSTSLECEANQPAPIGGGNVASDKSDQCRNL